LQELENYRGHWIAYGLGNFVFGSPGRFSKEHSPPYGLVARLSLDAAGRDIDKSLRLYPIYTDNRRSAYQARPVDAEQFEKVVSLLSERGPEVRELATRGEDQRGRFLAVDVGD